MLQFLSDVFWTLVIFAAVFAVFALLGYNALRALSEQIREAWSNIGVSAKKQASLTNQLIDVVRGYQESEKLVMLKVSEDVSNATALAQMHQQSGVVLASVAGMAHKFPELKADAQYQRLIDSIQNCESQLEGMRGRYNAAVKAYNTRRSSIPHVFYSATLGFKPAPYLEFSGGNLSADVDALQSFSSDADGARLNELLGSAATSAVKLGTKAISTGAGLAIRVAEGGKQLAEASQERRRAALSTTQPQGSGGDAASHHGAPLEDTAPTDARRLPGRDGASPQA